MDGCNGIWVNKPATADYKAVRGNTFILSFQDYNEDNTPFDLTGYTIVAELTNRNRSSSVPAEQLPFTCNILDAANGIFSITLSSDDIIRYCTYDEVYYFDVWRTIGAERVCLLQATLTLDVNYTTFA